MMFVAHRAPRRSLIGLAASLSLVAALQGCGSSDRDKAAEEQAEQTGFKKENLAKFAGRVRVDGQPPATDTALVVILNDSQHLDATAHGKLPKLYALCDAEGNFTFLAKPGKYVATFVELHQPSASERSGKTIGRGIGPGPLFGRGNLVGPDALKNLYNDPEKNANEEKFKVDLKRPGQTDYEVDLPVAGKEAVEPGPNAVTRFTTGK